MSGTALLFIMLVFAGFAQSQKKNIGRGATWFFVAAFLATASEAISPIMGFGGRQGPNEEVIVLVHVLQALGVLFAWIGAWRVLSDDSA